MKSLWIDITLQYHSSILFMFGEGTLDWRLKIFGLFNLIEECYVI